MHSEHKNIIIRTDASVKIGTGHLMRCIALAQAWENSQIFFVFAECPESLQQRIQREKFKILNIFSKPGTINDAIETAKIAKKTNSLWIILDGYHFKDNYINKLKNSDKRILLIDDYGQCKQCNADIILNQNPYATKALYKKVNIFAKLLLGTRYALIRKEFKPFWGIKKEIPNKASKILVTMGGSDPYNSTLKVIKALQQLPATIQSQVVVGSANPFLPQLIERAKSFPNIQILQNVSNMPELMSTADIIITSGGTTCYEACLMGLPNIILYSTANQKPVAQSLHSIGAAINLGHSNKVKLKTIINTIQSLVFNCELRKKMSGIGKTLVDGLGSTRILETMNGVFLRKVEKKDSKFVWNLSNSKSVREVSFNPNLISWSEHQKWFCDCLKNKNMFFYIAETADKKPIGQIRFKIKKSEAVVSTSLVEGYRGKGFGSAIIAKASNILLSSSKVKKIHAYIRHDNKNSIKAFEKAGYNLVPADNFAADNNAIHYIFEKISK